MEKLSGYTKHAYSRAGLVCPGENIFKLWRRGRELPSSLVAEITRNSKRARGNSFFKITENRKGIMVCARNKGNPNELCMITVLRLQESQSRAFKIYLGEESPKTENIDSKSKSNLKVKVGDVVSGLVCHPMRSVLDDLGRERHVLSFLVSEPPSSRLHRLKFGKRVSVDTTKEIADNIIERYRGNKDPFIVSVRKTKGKIFDLISYRDLE